MAIAFGGAVLTMTGVLNGYAAFAYHQRHQEAEKGDTKLSPDISSVASQMAGKSIEVHCGNEVFSELGDDHVVRTIGFVEPHRAVIPFIGVRVVAPSNDIYLRQPVCRRIFESTDGERSGSFQDVRSLPESAYMLQVLSHEIEHTNGTYDEAEAECHAFQNLPDRMRLLGFDEVDISNAVTAVEVLQEDRLSDAYRSAECTQGGAYDLAIEGPYAG